MKRNRAIDYEKGFVVAAMVLCHVIQFFGDWGKYPEQQWIELAINATAFSTFVFAYGRSVYLAYLSKPFKAAAPRLLGSAVRSYGVFCVSGIAYNVLCNGKKFNLAMIKKVVHLKDIPGWSEFLAAFAALGLVVLALFPLLKKLLERPKLHGLVAAACLLGTLIPYESIRDTRLGLLIGTTQFSCFPVLQYFPFFLMGLYVEKHGMKKLPVWLAGSAVLTGVGVGYTVFHGTPGRFPPTALWLIMPCLVIVLLDRLAEAIDRLTRGRVWARKLASPVESMGRNSLLYLLASNLVLFSLRCMAGAGLGALPEFRRSAAFPFSLETGSTPWALFWTLTVLLGIAFANSLSRKPKG